MAENLRIYNNIHISYKLKDAVSLPVSAAAQMDDGS